MVSIGGQEFLNTTEAGRVIGRSRWGWASMVDRGEVPPATITDGPRVQYWPRELVERVREGMRAGVPRPDLRSWLAVLDGVDCIRGGGDE